MYHPVLFSKHRLCNVVNVRLTRILSVVPSSVLTITVTLSYTDDDYKTYTTVSPNGDLSVERVRWRRLGLSRRRGWVLTHAAATPMGLYQAEGRATIGDA